MKKLLVCSLLLILIGLIATPAYQAQGVVNDLLGRINTLRGSLDLPAYTLNSALTAAAQEQADWMVATGQVSHVQEDGSRPSTRAQRHGYQSSWVSENIYMGGLATVDSAWNFWLNSPIHYAGLTSSNYREVGIASATGTGGQAFVLVFGVPGGQVSAPQGNRSSDNSANAAVPAQPPSAIIGYDAVGNIQYELQAGDTLGDVLLTFGYTWDDLNTLLALNNLTEADIVALDVGQVILVPPPQGTYTPTAVADSTEQLDSDTAFTHTPTAVADSTEQLDGDETLFTHTPNANGILPTPADFTTAIATPTLIPTRTPLSSPTPIASSVPTNRPSATPTHETGLRVNSPPNRTEIARVSTAPSQTSIPAATSNADIAPPMWLIIAIAVQVLILIIASVQFARRQ